MLCAWALFAQARAYGQTAAALGDTFSAAATGRGGAMAAESGDPLDAVEGNPAGLAGLDGRMADLGAAALGAYGSFQNSVDPNGKLTGAGVLPVGAVGGQIGSSPWRVSLAATPDMLMRANWRYIDPAGTAGVSYGSQSVESEIIAVRSSVGVARPMGAHWDVGATLGLDYNKNVLNSPYIFQQQPVLAGLKVLLQLHTEGLGWNGSAGLQWHPNSRLRMGAAWKSATDVETHGAADGTASALFTALGVTASPLYSYNAEVDNHFPWTLAMGGSWQANHRLLWDLEGDWTAWGNAFHQLPVKLTDGTNPVINSVAGSNALEDFVPLDWHDQATIRTGVETPIGERWTARAGYAYSSDPVPSSTLTPMTAAILRNSIGAGGGWYAGHWRIDAAYQAQLPASESVGTSILKAGEFNDSRVSAMTQSVAITVRKHF
jgi:long-subunit fatty acid transport protein